MDEKRLEDLRWQFNLWTEASLRDLREDVEISIVVLQALLDGKDVSFYSYHDEKERLQYSLTVDGKDYSISSKYALEFNLFLEEVGLSSDVRGTEMPRVGTKEDVIKEVQSLIDSHQEMADSWRETLKKLK